MKYGIFGGTFDPIHTGHLLLVEKAMDIFSLERVFMVPTGVSYLKSGVSAAADRLEMTRRAVWELADERLVVDDVEILREGSSYTYETLEYYKESFPEDDCYLIIGEDSLRYIEKWRCSKRIFELSTILVAGRNESYHPAIGNDMGYSEASLDTLIRDLTDRLECRIEFFAFDCDVSSTEIRRSLKNGEDVSAYLTDSVKQYIDEKGLYRL